MHECILIEPSMEPIPEAVRVKHDFGEVQIRTDDGRFVWGRHVIVEASPEALRAWLARFDAVWMGVGPPNFQDFTVMHVRGDACG
jgi:hypothetical protein